MIFDFTHTCKTYDENFYKKSHFTNAICPGCSAARRFKLHGSYSRHVVFLENDKLTHKSIEIKRIRCISCGITHAVMPRDIIPYKLLSLYAVLFILTSHYLLNESVLEVSKTSGFSFQFVYSSLYAFQLHTGSIVQYFRETIPKSVPVFPDNSQTLKLIQRPYFKFQYGYIQLNKRPCFMCRFFNRSGAPPIGCLPLNRPHEGGNMGFE